MKIETLKELKQLVKACRQMGIDKIKVDNLEIDLGVEPVVSTRSARKLVAASEDHVFVPGGVDETTPIVADRIDMPDELTEEQKMFWSATGGQELGPGEEV